MSTILVTGANRGIGLEFVKQYMAMGEQVIGTYRDVGSSDELIKLSEESSALDILNLDVASDDSMAAFPTQLGDRPVDIFINNAGVYGPRDSSFGNVDEANWIPVLRINALAPLLLTQLIVENLSRGKSKKLLYVTSKMGSIDDNKGGGSYVYRSSKAALNAVVKSISVDLASEEMSVAVLHPGWVRTDMGGPNAPLSVGESIDGIMDRIVEQDLGLSGRYVEYDGSLIEW